VSKISIIFTKNKASYTVPFCDPNLNLLAHAQSEELEIGSICGGHGVCGGDKVIIDLDVQKKVCSPLTEDERKHLSSAQIAAGYRLACQCWPNQPTELRVRVASVTL